MGGGETGPRPPNFPRGGPFFNPTKETRGGGAAGDAPPAEAAPLPTPQEKTAKPRKRLWVLLGAAILVCALIAALLLIHNNKAKQVLYTDENGKQYTAELFQQETPREDGKAWLSTEQTLRVQKSEGNEMWMYDFIFHERNGIGFKIDRLEVYTFLDNDVHPQIISGDMLDEYGLGSYIPANGDWSVDGGMPVQKKVASIGVILSGTDDNGEKLTFPGYLNLIGLD